MKLELYQEVALTRDFPEHHLQKGDVATLIDYVKHPEGEEDGCILEVFNALGDSLAVVILPQTSVEPLRADNVLTVRTIDDTRMVDPGK